MAKFTYRAVRSTGEEYDGEVEAPDRFAVYDIIRKDGSSILTVDEKTGFAIHITPDDVLNLIRRVKISEMLMLTRNIAAMLKAGLPISRAIDIMERQSNNPKLKKVLHAVNEEIRRGSSFHEALAKFPQVFPPLMSAMVKAGEESGKLAESLLVVGGQLEKSYTLKRKIRGAMMYPTIVIIAMILISIVMLMMVVPTLTATFAELDVELPVSTQIIVGISHALTSYPFFMLAGLLLLGGGLYAAYRSKKGKRFFDMVWLRFPLISPLVKQTNAARTTRTLASLLSAGVEVVHALSITTEVLQNTYYKEVVAKAGEVIQKGSPISKIFIENQRLYPVLVGEMIAVGEETGELSAMLEDVAEFFEGEVEQKTKDLSTIIEPLLMIFIGAGVGFFAYAMILPIYSISNSI